MSTAEHDVRSGRTDRGETVRDRPGSPSPSQGDGRTRGERSARSLTHLLRDLSGDGVDLVRQEVALARAELQEKLETFQRSTAMMVVGGTFLLAALLFATWALNTGLVALLAEWISVAVAVWLSPLILAVLLAIVGGILIQSGRSAIQREGVSPTRTRESLEEDARWARTRARDLKEEMTHG